MRVPITIERDSTFECDRSLDASRFQRDTGYAPPPWDIMIDEMASHMTEGCT
jgi:dTDP-4-dehydrorhamnose reductase